MKAKDWLTKTLSFLGTLLAWFPILAPILLGVVMLGREGRFLFDYLMPAELFFIALGGGLLLLWAAIRAHRLRLLIGGSLGAAALALFAGQALAVATGLASGETEPGGWQWALVLVTLAVYWLALIAVGVGGGMLLRGLFRRIKPV
jgi:hypothetical protein